MRNILFTALGAAAIFSAGVYTGKAVISAPEPATAAEAYTGEEFLFADASPAPEPEAVQERNLATVSHSSLPEDMFIRLKNESEKKTEKARKEEAKPEKQETPQPVFTRDDKSTAHAEAAEGIKDIERGDYASAVNHLEKAFGLYNDKAIAAHYLQALIMLGESEKAAEVLKAAYLDENTAADVIEIAVKKGKHEEALKLFEAYPAGGGRLMHSAGLAFEAAGNTDKAIEMYKKAYAAEPDNPAISFSMARAADIKGDYLTALTLYEKTARESESTELKRYATQRSTRIMEYLPSLRYQNSLSPE